MTTPADNADSQTQGSEFTNSVNAAIASMTKDDKGNYVLPDELPEEVKVAATLEKRRRDTQASYTRSQQENKALKEEKAALLRKLNSTVKIELTPEQQEEFEQLKFDDPEAWRKKMNALENEARQKQDEQINSELKQISTSSLDKEELARRKEILSEFNQEHPDFQLTDELIANEIPPRIVKKLENGKSTFEEFLQECYEYTHTGKTIKQDKVLTGPNLSKIGGGNTPDKTAVTKDMQLSYKKEVY